MRYYVNKIANKHTGKHEVHTEKCRHCPDTKGRIYLDNFNSCGLAMKEAQKKFDEVDGCVWCCNTCHDK